MKDFYQIYVAGHIVPNVEISSVINAHVQVEAANFGDPFIFGARFEKLRSNYLLHRVSLQIRVVAGDE